MMMDSPMLCRTSNANLMMAHNSMASDTRMLQSMAISLQMASSMYELDAL